MFLGRPMKVNVYNGGVGQEILGANVCELEFLDGRRVQISTDTSESGLILLRVHPAGGYEVHGNMDALTLSFHIGEKDVEIRYLHTRISS